MTSLIHPHPMLLTKSLQEICTVLPRKTLWCISALHWPGLRTWFIMYIMCGGHSSILFYAHRHYHKGYVPDLGIKLKHDCQTHTHKWSSVQQIISYTSYIWMVVCVIYNIHHCVCLYKQEMIKNKVSTSPPFILSVKSWLIYK